MDGSMEIRALRQSRAAAMMSFTCRNEENGASRCSSMMQAADMVFRSVPLRTAQAMRDGELNTAHNTEPAGGKRHFAPCPCTAPSKVRLLIKYCLLDETAIAAPCFVPDVLPKTNVLPCP
eukprot:1143774-Pelagomonas_calceolata.AAC.3